MGDGYSLKQYEQKDTAEIQRAKKEFETMRNHKATQQPMQGWRGGIFTYPNDNINWGVKYTTDSILTNNGIPSSSIKTNGWEKANNIFGIVAGGVALVGTGASIFGSLGAKKTGDGSMNAKVALADNELASEVVNTLDSCIKAAQEVDKKTSFDRLNDISKNLESVIGQATEQKNAALNSNATARAGLTTAENNIKKHNETKKIANTRIEAIDKEIGNLEKSITEDMSDEQKAGIKAKIEKLKKDKETQNNTVEACDEAIKKCKEDIIKHNKTISENTELIKILEAKLKEGKSEREKLNKKIDK